MKSIYLDYAASTPVLPEVVSLMRRYFLKDFGNAGSLHSYGQLSMRALDEARALVAEVIGSEFSEVIFTGSATEANNLVMRGAVAAFRVLCSERVPRIIISAIEHDSVFETAKELEREGVILSVVPVDKKGVVNAQNISQFLHEDTVLVSVMHGNNEVGTVQPISDIAKVIVDFRKEKAERGCVNGSTIYPLFHTDAAQSFQYLDCDAKAIPFDFMTISGHKIFGPKGVGALYVRNKMKTLRDIRSAGGVLRPVLFGGGQEYGLRAGTENVPLVAGFGMAVSEAFKRRRKSFLKVFEIRRFFIERLRKSGIEARVFNEDQFDEMMLPHIVSVFFPKRSAQDLLIALDLQGVAVSSGSACSMRSLSKSRVLSAITEDEDIILGTLRFSFSMLTSKDEVLRTMKALKAIGL